MHGAPAVKDTMQSNNGFITIIQRVRFFYKSHEQDESEDQVI